MHHRLGKPRLASSGLFFSLGEVVSIGNQMISALRLLHGKGFVHRDVQPGNIVYDFTRKRVLLIDYGAAQRYRNTTDPRHSSQTKPGMIGSIVFTSLSSHRGDTLSGRDDLESLGYVLVYLFHGQLPWQHLFPQANDEIFAKKSSILTEDRCGRFEPFNGYFQSVKRLSFEQTPDYAGLQGMLEALVA
jgi:casein kinase I family protein HRR25